MPACGSPISANRFRNCGVHGKVGRLASREPSRQWSGAETRASGTGRTEYAWSRSCGPWRSGCSRGTRRAAAPPLPPFRCGNRGRAPFHRSRTEPGCRATHLVEGPSRMKPHDDVHPARPAFEVFGHPQSAHLIPVATFTSERYPCAHIRPTDAVTRIEIDPQLVGIRSRSAERTGCGCSSIQPRLTIHAVSSGSVIDHDFFLPCGPGRNASVIVRSHERRCAVCALLIETPHRRRR